MSDALPDASPPHVAVLDDEEDITQLLSGYLGQHGLRVTALHRGRDLVALLSGDDPPALVLLDLGLPGEDGLAIARQVRERWHCGLVIVTGRGDAVDRVVGLELGADDYVTKPFDLRELLARVRSVLRRLAPPRGRAGEGTDGAASGSSVSGDSSAAGTATSPASAHRLVFAGWTLDLPARRLLDPQGAEVALTTGEFDLLAVFAREPGHVLSRDTLLERTRGRTAGPFDRTIDVQVGRLRRKLRDDPADPRLLKSVRGAGYLLAVPEDGAR